VMIARLGAVELRCLLNHQAIHRDASLLGKTLDYVKGEAKAPWWEKDTITSMTKNAGFFPPDTSLLDRFCDRMLDDMRCVDVLGSWLAEEELFAAELRNAVKVRLRDLEPYYHRDPWTEA